jgi:hypothetical protein
LNSIINIEQRKGLRAVSLALFFCQKWIDVSQKVPFLQSTTYLKFAPQGLSVHFSQRTGMIVLIQNLHRFGDSVARYELTAGNDNNTSGNKKMNIQLINGLNVPYLNLSIIEYFNSPLIEYFNTSENELLNIPGNGEFQEKGSEKGNFQGTRVQTRDYSDEISDKILKGDIL